jgi:hypothetical protein
MSTIHAEGKFSGRITDTDFEQDRDNPDGLILCFTIKLDDGHQAVARHRTHGAYSHIARKMIEEFGLDWPKGVLSIGTLVGRDVPVKIKHKTSKNGTVYENAYIDFGGSQNEPADSDFVKRAVEKMAETPIADDGLPF